MSDSPSEGVRSPSRVRKEAPSLAKPVLVLRQVTERPEAVLKMESRPGAMVTAKTR